MQGLQLGFDGPSNSELVWAKGVSPRPHIRCSSKHQLSLKDLVWLGCFWLFCWIHLDTLFDPYPLRVGNTKVYFWRWNQRPLTMQCSASRSCRHREVQLGVQVSGTLQLAPPARLKQTIIKVFIYRCLMKYMVFFSNPESCTLKYVQLYMVLPASLAELWQYRPTLITGNDWCHQEDAVLCCEWVSHCSLAWIPMGPVRLLDIPTCEYSCEWKW